MDEDNIKVITFQDSDGNYAGIEKIGKMFREGLLNDSDNTLYGYSSKQTPTKITAWIPHSELRLMIKLSDDIVNRQKEMLWIN